MQDLKELNKDLKNQSSDEDYDDEEEEKSSELKKRQREDPDIKVSQNLIVRKRDMKGNYKSKFNLEKLIIEHEKKQILLKELNEKKQEMQEQLNSLRTEIGKKVQSGEQEVKASNTKSHWDFLIKEMIWMAEDFEREHKKKISDCKKQVKICKRQLQEKNQRKEKEQKDMKIELRKKANNMSKMVQLYWKSVEKVVKHNYNILYEKQRQQVKAKKLENFVNQHLRLSKQVAEQLNTKSFVEQSMYNKEDKTQNDAEQGIVQVREEAIQGQNLSKRRKINVIVKKGKDGYYEVDQEFEQSQILHSQMYSQPEGDFGFTRAKIAEQTVEMAKSFQPTGFTLSSVKVKTQVPFLLHGVLREYQIIGLDWLVTLHNRKLNGILADEMGLGKTIQTISLLASLACDKGIWGPHLIVVPTTIIINWEMEFKKWAPAFKILTYFGSQKERKMKRHGWSKENSFHVCITSYKLVIQDHFAFRRKKWYYMVLDEAQNIKNFKSQRWQTLLRFNTKRRLLLTGTPLQNDVMELWSLMHFLMPNIFSSQQDFKEWFSNPFNQSINQNQSLNISVVQKLQSILRPFLLRRMKRDVEKQLPEKIEHVIPCTLSRRQRLLYDEYINSDKTKQTLSETDFFSIMNVLMQLRKVCNHPDLFEPRTIESPFIMQERIGYRVSQMVFKALQYNPMKDVNMKSLNFVLSEFESIAKTEYQTLQQLYPQKPLVQVIGENSNNLDQVSESMLDVRPIGEGLAVGKKLPINCNVLNKQNTKNLIQTLPNVVQFESNAYHQIPNYLNSASLPFPQKHYSLYSYDHLRYSTRNQEFSSLDTYMSSLSGEESKQRMLKLAEKLIQWREYDQTNRMNLMFQKPIYGEDCRKAIKVNTLFSDVFDNKRHKNLDRYNKGQQSTLNDLSRVPQTIYNSFALKQSQSQNSDLDQITVENWLDQTEEQIEQSNLRNSYIKEVPRSIQLRNKKRKQQQKQQQLAQRQQMLLEQQQQQLIPTKVFYHEQQISLVLNMKNIKKGNEDECWEEDLNKNVEAKVEQIQKERIEMKRMEIVKPPEEIEKNKTDNMDLPYQRVYSNASRRFRREEQLDSDSKDEDVDEMEIDEKNNEEKQINEELKETNEDQGEEQKEGQKEEKDEEMKKEGEGEEEEVKEEKKEVEQQEEQDVEEVVEKQEEENIYSITYKNTEYLRDLIVTPLQRAQMMEENLRQFKIIIPKVVVQTPEIIPSKLDTKHQKDLAYERFYYQKLMSHRNVNQSLKHSNILYFPHKNLIQYDCGKLQSLARLLKRLYSQGSKVLIFTQMTRVLDILENFLNIHGYTYVRLDGSVKVEMRQKLVDKFNLNKKIFCFISSTRCGGIGINLTGADCVVFYDSDWNPAMDKQAQDRCHRIGQTKTVNIYRLISTNTIEENIFKKSLQKRELGGLIIEGTFDMEFFKKVSLKDILADDDILKPQKKDIMKEENIVFHVNAQTSFDQEEDEQMNFEKQREIEQYRRRFEEALVKIEDKEDVIALQQAKREIDEEFDEEALNPDATSRADTNADGQANQEEGKGEEGANAQDSKTAQELYKEMKRSEFINWRTHPTLNEATKQSIEWYEENYSFNQYLEDRSKKDSKFVHPLEEEDKNEKKKKDDSDADESDFSMSEEEDENSENEQLQQWNRRQAEQAYSVTKNEIQSRYFIV